uniref:Uncharacterized protein n=1 Tax=Rhizophora mucronata TaxID=61149 RepID=A0A2P2QE43_RHIMU
MSMHEYNLAVKFCSCCMRISENC